MLNSNLTVLASQCSWAKLICWLSIGKNCETVFTLTLLLSKALKIFQLLKFHLSVCVYHMYHAYCCVHVCVCVHVCACIQAVCLCGLISVSLCVPSPSPCSCQSPQRPSASCRRWVSSSWHWPSSSSSSTRNCVSHVSAVFPAWRYTVVARKDGLESARASVSDWQLNDSNMPTRVGEPGSIIITYIFCHKFTGQLPKMIHFTEKQQNCGVWILSFTSQWVLPHFKVCLN